MEEVTGRAIIITGYGFFCMKEINKESNNKKNKEKSNVKVLSVSFDHSIYLTNIKKRQESQIWIKRKKFRS